MPAKQGQRNLILEKLRNQKEEEAQKKSVKIKEKLFRLKVFKEAQTVMFYLACAGEVQTQAMVEAAIKLGKKVVIPACDIKARKIIPCLLSGLGKKNLKKGPYGIDEPCQRWPVNHKDIDLVIVPGIAFDLQGNRLGRGLGYYDRFLASLPKDTPKVGIAFRFQVFNRLTNCLPHDCRVDKVLLA